MGAVTVTVTLAAKFVVVVVTPFVVVLVMVELLTVPNVQIRLPLVTADPQVPWLALAEVDPEFGASVSVNITPVTGSPVL